MRGFSHIHIHFKFQTRHAWLLCEIFLAVACLYGTYELVLRLLYELRGPITADSPLYLAVGRGMLNGLMPYRDLFENKPPGIFLLSALSVWFSGGMQLMSVMQALIIFSFPVLVVFGSDSILRRETAVHRHCAFLLAFLFGIVMALYTAERSGEFQVESFGAFFATLYVVVIADPDARFGKARTALASFAILCAVMLKEPFILPIVASALLLCSYQPSLLWRRFCIPLGIAGGTTLLLLSLSGIIGPYVSIYLNEMFFYHVSDGSSPLSRAWQWIRIFGDLQQFQSYLGIFIFLLIAKVFLREVQVDTSGRMFIRVRHLLCILAALYLLALSVGMGGHFFNHHFAFAVPGYIALFLLCLHEMEEGTLRRFHSKGIFALAVVGLLVFSNLSRPDYRARLTDINSEVSISKKTASVIDRTLDACGLQTYLFIGSNGWMMPYGFTNHSPLGPNFYQYHDLLDSNHTKFRETFLQNLRKTQLIVFREYMLADLQNSVDEYLKKDFTLEPWSCARGFEGPPEFTILYRHQQDAVMVAMGE